MVLALCLSAFAACSADEQVSSHEPKPTLTNDGTNTSIVIGELAVSDERTALLREIADKYEADFANTAVEIRTYADSAELEKALRAGEVDIAEVASDNQQKYVNSGLLLDFYSYLTMWDEAATLTQPARFVLESMGAEKSYVMPLDFDQNVIYYRLDWQEEYNATATRLISCRSWDLISGYSFNGEWKPGFVEVVPGNSKLALAGGDELLKLFDSVIFSSVSAGRLADLSAAYFSSVEGHTTIFTHEKAKAGAEQFLRVVENALVPQALGWTQEQAIEAFCNEEVGLLIADRTAYDKIAAALPEGSWSTREYPIGDGSAVFDLKSYSGWGVSSGVENPENVMHFLAFLSNADNNTYYAKIFGTLPIHGAATDLEPSLTGTDLYGELAMSSRGDKYICVTPPVNYAAYSGFEKIADEKLRSYISGEISTDELLSFFDEYWSAALKDEGVLW